MKIFGKKSGEAVFVTCAKCGRRSLKPVWVSNLNVCSVCGSYRPLGGHSRLKSIFDRGAFREIYKNVMSGNPLDFPDYGEKLKETREKTGLADGCVCGVGKIHGIQAVVGVMDSRFMMGSMGTGIGEKITLTVEYAISKKLPLIIFSASGGARMQEGIYGLMQMAKTSGAISRLDEAGGLFISVLTNPTMGGVTASFASLGDIILAEPGALVGFAGPRVIEQTIGEKLPQGFQKSEFQEEHGFVDMVVPRNEMRDTLGRLLKIHHRR